MEADIATNKSKIYFVNDEVIKVPNHLCSIELDVLINVAPECQYLCKINKINITENNVSIHMPVYTNILNHPNIANWKFQRKVMWEVAVALNFLHSNGICHNDITVSNVMYNLKADHAVLIDFGNCTIVDDLNPITDIDLLPMCARLPSNGNITMNRHTDAWCYLIFCLSLATKGASEFIMVKAFSETSSENKSTVSDSSIGTSTSSGETVGSERSLGSVGTLKVLGSLGHLGQITNTYITKIKSLLTRIAFHNNSVYPVLFRDLIEQGLSDTMLPDLSVLVCHKFFSECEPVPVFKFKDYVFEKCTVSNRMEIMYYAVSSIYEINVATCFHLVDLLDRYYLVKYSDNRELPEFIYKEDVMACLYILNTFYPIHFSANVNKQKVTNLIKYMILLNIPLWRPTVYDIISGTINNHTYSAIHNLSISEKMNTVDTLLMDFIAGVHTDISLNTLLSNNAKVKYNSFDNVTRRAVKVT
jgi:serine/threonine protein kinase